MELQLRAWRTHSALSQSELAERATVTKQTIVALEKPNHRRPHPRTVRKLAKALGVAPSQLYTAPTDQEEPTP
jgi:transcriptional regulator with XRE-family HTH domain